MQGWAGIPVPGHFREYRPTIPVPKVGNEFSTRIPIPKNWEWNFPLAFPFPKIGNGIFHSHSHSRKLGIEFSTCILIPESWEWNLPFQLPSFPRIPTSHSRSRKLGMEFSFQFQFQKIVDGSFHLQSHFRNLGICHSQSRS